MVEQLRYLVHFSDGGAGMRLFKKRPAIDDELRDGGASYRFVRVEHHEGESGFRTCLGGTRPVRREGRKRLTARQGFDRPAGRLRRFPA